MPQKKSKKLTRKQKEDLSWIDRLDPDADWVDLEPRLKKLQVKRDYRYYDRYVLGMTGDKVTRIYQLKAASPMIYLQRNKLQKNIEKWMRAEGCFTDQEIQAWSMPRFEWPEERITPEQEAIIEEWREKYKIKDRTDWNTGITLSKADKEKLDKYRQISILQPRQTGKSEVVVRVNGYVMTVVHEFNSAVFAPTEDQAKDFIFQRTRDYIEENAFYKGRFKRINALDMTLEAAPIASGSSFAAVSASPTANIEGDSLDWAILDESQDITDYKVKKSIKFMMAAKQGAMIKIGTVNTIKGHFWESTTKKGSKFWHQVLIYPDICAATNNWWKEFIENVIEEDGRWSDTVRMSVFLEWLLSLGMFMTEEQWDSMQKADLEWVPYDKKGLQYATIDVAKSRDETIVMVGKVDPTRVFSGRHPLRILNVLTLPGIDYDSQFHEIKAWLDTNYKVAAIGIDDTGGRGGLADRFEHTPYRVEAFTYTRPGKSEWYTNLQTMINAHYTAFQKGLHHEMLIEIPGSKAAQKEKIHRDFAQQMLDLLREYKDKYLVVHHPDIEGAKDDYSDAFMMLAWMASRVMTSIDDMIDAVEDISETRMDKLDWNEDIDGQNRSARRTERKSKRQAEDDEELLEIQRGASDLDSIF